MITYVKKRNGRLVEYNPDKINKSAERACAGLPYVSASELVLDAEFNLYDKISTSEIDDALIMSAREKIQKTPEFSYVAARILFSGVYRDVFGDNIDSDEFDNDYRAAFRKHIRNGVKHGRLHPDMGKKFNLAKLSEAIDWDRDNLFKYLGAKIIVDRYLLRDGDNKLTETPQAFWMRVAMGLSLNEDNPTQRAIEFYDVISKMLYTPSTPTLFNSGCVHSQLSSCFARGCMVETPNGPVPIEKIIKGDLVLTEQGRYRVVEETRSKRPTAPVVSMRIAGINASEDSFVCTDDHLVYAIRYDQIKCSRNSTIKCIGNQRSHTRCFKTANCHKSDCDNIDVDWDTSITGQWLPVNQLSAGDFVKVVCPLERQEFELDIIEYVKSKQNYQTIDGKLYRLKSTTYSSDDPINRTVNPINRYYKSSYDLGLWFGYYLAEGWNSGTTLQFTFNRAEEQTMVADVIKLTEQLFGLSSTIVRPKTDQSIVVSINSRLLCKFVDTLVGKGFAGKRLPKMFMTANDEFVTGLLIGAIRGDGWTVSSINEVTLSNHGLINQLFELHAKLGHLPSIRRAQEGPLSTTTPYTTTCSTNNSVDFTERLNELTDYVYAYPTKTTSHIVVKDGTFYRIKSISPCPEYNDDVFDLQVDGDHSFVVNHVAVHNCYLNTYHDSIDGIFDGLWQEARKSKYAGGLGIDVTPFRAAGAEINGTPKISKGIVPWLKLFNDLLIAVDQKGKRPGAGCAYLEPWHKDYLKFLELRRNSGDDRMRAHDLNIATWAPDIFMRYVAEEKDWYMFCPHDTPDLHELVGEQFDKRYLEYCKAAQDGTLTNFSVMPAKDLWKRMISMLFETSHPWLTFKDPCNIAYANQHQGVVHSSNLCSEITLHTKPSQFNDDGKKTKVGETAVCNLGSINLLSHVKQTSELGTFEIDQSLLEHTIMVAKRMLDNVIDLNFYPTQESKNSNLKHRPVGLGVMGLHDVLHKFNIAIDSDEAVAFNDTLFETISMFAIKSSALLAKERGAYSTYKGSLWDKGIFPIDSWRNIHRARALNSGGEIDTDSIRETLDWTETRQLVEQHGLRNGLNLAIAPTATIGYINGVEQSIEPNLSILFVQENKSGNFYVVNEHFVDDMRRAGLWSPSMADMVRAVDGDVSQLDIPDLLKRKYASVRDRDMYKLIECNAVRQKWIDQAISFNMYFFGTSGKQLSDLYQYAWKVGLKTTYYLRGQGATKIEKATVDQKSKLADITPQPTACSINALLNGGTCESCQ